MSARSRRRPYAATNGSFEVSRRPRVEPGIWLGAGAVTLGIGVALVGGAGAAHAEDAGDSGGPSTSNPSSASESSPGTRPSKTTGDDDTGATAPDRESDTASKPDVEHDVEDTDSPESDVTSDEPGSPGANLPAEDEGTVSSNDEVPGTPEPEESPEDSSPSTPGPQSHARPEPAPADRGGDTRRPGKRVDEPASAPPATSAAASADEAPDVASAPARGDAVTEVVQTAAAPAAIATVVPAATSRPSAAEAITATGARIPAITASKRPDPGLSFTRLALAVETVLKPFGTLLTELGGLILGTRADPIPPGACRDGVCNPNTDIFLPFVRNEVTVLNLTGRPVTLTDLSTKQPLTYGPQKGFVLANARQVELAFYQGNSEWDDDWTYEGTMKWSDGSTTVTVDVEAGGATSSTSNSGVQTVIFETPESIGGPSAIALRQTMVLLPQAGTVVTIDSTDPVGQALVAAALCKVSGSCIQEVVGEQVMLSAPKQVGNTLFNGGSVVSTNRYKVVHEVTKTSGVEENLKVVAGTSLNFALGPLAFQSEIGALVQQKYGHSWSDGVTTESQVDLDVPPGSYGQIYVQYPEYHDYVDMTLTNSGVTIKIPDVTYVSLAPSGTVDKDGKPVAVTYTTVDWEIGSGPHPFPDSQSVPTPPTSVAVDWESPHDIAAPLAPPAAQPRSLIDIAMTYVKDQVEAFRMLPNVLFAGRAVSSQTIRVVNLTPYAQTLSSITGEYEEDESPLKGFVLQPFQEIDIEVDFNVFQDQETYVTWTNVTGIDASAELKVFNGGSAPRVTCQSDAGCMSGSFDSESAVMYLIYPQATPGRLDVTDDPNLASAAVDAACAPGYNGSLPGSCGVNVTGDVYYNAPTSGPVQQQINLGSQTNSYYYTITTTKGESASWAAGGGVKLKEKAGVFIGLQIELEASVLYNSSVQVKDSESSTVVQNLLPDYGGAMYVGDPYLRTYGDYIVNLPNLTMIVTGQWIEAASGLSAQGPVANVVDYPLT